MWQLALVAVSGTFVFVMGLFFTTRKGKIKSLRRELETVRAEDDYQQKIAELKDNEVKEAAGLRDDPDALSRYLNDIIGGGGSGK